MNRQLALIATAIGAIAAMATPLSASATTLTMEEFVPPETAIEGSSSNVAIKHLPEGLGGGSLHCESLTITGKITENGEGTVAAAGTGGTSKGCSQTDEAGKKHEATFTNPALTELSTTETGTGSINLTFQVDLPNIKAECHFVSHTGTFDYLPGSDELEVTAARLTATQELCENEEEAVTFTGNFTLTTEGGGTVALK